MRLPKDSEHLESNHSMAYALKLAKDRGWSSVGVEKPSNDAVQMIQQFKRLEDIRNNIEL